MEVNIVTVRSGWILQKIAERIAKAGNSAKLGKFTVGHNPRIGVDVNFYCDIQNCYSGPTNALDIGLFTHVHADDISNVRPETYGLDYIFHMASRYKDMFVENKLYPHSKMGLMIPWEMPECFNRKKIKLGIFQRGRYQGKGFDRMMRLMDTKIAENFAFIFVGNDWEQVVQKGLSNGISCAQYTDKTVKYPEGYERLYEHIDYLLIPSEWEGGPICALEAAAKGLPIISADVGWVSEIVSYAQIFKSDEGLHKILGEIIGDAIVRRSYVDPSLYGPTYEKCAKRIIETAEVL